MNENGIVIERLAASPEQIIEEKGGKDAVRVADESTVLTPSDAPSTATDEHTRPSTINVRLENPTNYQYYGQSAPFTKSIDFYYYVKNVLPNEWGYSSEWLDKSLQSGALAVKMYGWYHVYHPKWPSYNAAVKDNIPSSNYFPDQTFEVVSEQDRTTQAINAVGGIGVDRADGLLFETQHWQGYEREGGQYGGTMWQLGTKYWAEQGKGYTYMVHYYYDYSPNTGDLLAHFFYY